MKKMLILVAMAIMVATLFVQGGDVITTGRSAPFYYTANDQWTEIDAALLSRNMKTVSLTVGAYDDSVSDVNFAADVDTTEQTLDLGSIVPAFARVTDVSIVCIEDVNSSAGDCSFSTDAGTGGGGAQWIASAVDANEADVCLGSAAGAGSLIAITASMQKVYMNSTPGQNWSTLDAGRWVVVVSYIDVAAIVETED